MIRFLLQHSRWTLLLSIVAGLGSGAGGVGLIVIINRALEPKAEFPADPAWIFAALCVVLLMTRAVSSWLLIRLGQDVVLGLRVKLSRQVLAAPLARLQSLGSARILACLTQDVTTIATAIQWLPTLCISAAIVAGSIAYLGWLSKELLVLIAATMVLGIGSFRLVESRAKRGLGLARDCDDALQGHFRSLTQGIKELKLSQPRRAAFLADCLENDAARYRRHYLSGVRLYILASNWGSGLFYVLIGLILFGLPQWQQFAPEVLRGYCLALIYMMTPLQVLVDGLPNWSRALVSLKKIEALSRETEDQEAQTATAPYPSTQPATLELSGVSHRYKGGRDERNFTLGPIDLTLHPGELVFLVGGNGSGKTTLSLLLVGLYAPEQGEIRLNGRPVTAADRDSYRQQFAAVFSDFYLFDSLLGFDNRELDAEARAYLAHLQLDHKVRIANGAFSTLDLSQGQRKRLALLVAYLEDRPFYVFDEWAADQDPEFKKIFYLEILPTLKSRGKTIIVITHDDQYFHIADRCLKLEDGKLYTIPVGVLSQNFQIGLREPKETGAMSPINYNAAMDLEDRNRNATVGSYNDEP